jgi:hypothetical protein
MDTVNATHFIGLPIPWSSLLASGRSDDFGSSQDFLIPFLEWTPTVSIRVKIDGPVLEPDCVRAYR